jgi:hypothetical protein
MPNGLITILANIKASNGVPFRSPSGTIILDRSGTKRGKRSDHYAVISFANADEHMRDLKVGKEKLKSVKEKIRKILGDKSYDSKSIYYIFGETAEISPRRNASTKSKR